MDKYGYLFIPVFLFLPWLALYILNKDLRSKILRTSIIGGFAGFVAEYWYFKDYWQPPLLFGPSALAIEDFLFGFFNVGISVSIYDALFTKKAIKGGEKKKKEFGILFLTGVIVMISLTDLLGINSIFTSTIAFMVFAIIIVLMRRDLLVPSFVSGLLMLLLMAPIYAIIFNVLAPTFWDSYWFLAKTKYGVTVFGNVPVTELFWYFSWGCLGGVLWDFTSGNRKEAKYPKS